ncbi:MAG: hypothetical protein FJ090_20070, partial [Deltaproteobacteria bacterium]|nr:hypothetical protein [Deltaproteobacteria bacterium]
FGAFVALLGTTTADYRIGVTTTDPENGGVLVGPVLTADTDDVITTFTGIVNVGTSGNRDEQGLAMAALGVRGDVNPGFLRSDAYAHVVFVSDEDDHSEGDAERYVDALRQSAPGLAVYAHALVGDEPAGCLSGTSAAGAGSRYLAVATALDGLTESICSDDYALVLEAIGLQVSGWNPVFPLTEIAASATIEVNVDGAYIPEREADGWRYSIGDNAVIFSGRAVPRPGMEVLVSYRKGG